MKTSKVTVLGIVALLALIGAGCTTGPTTRPSKSSASTRGQTSSTAATTSSTAEALRQIGLISEEAGKVDLNK